MINHRNIQLSAKLKIYGLVVIDIRWGRNMETVQETHHKVRAIPRALLEVHHEHRLAE